MWKSFFSIQCASIFTYKEEYGILVTPDTDEGLIFLKVKKVPWRNASRVYMQVNQLKRFYHIVLSTKVELLLCTSPWGQKGKGELPKATTYVKTCHFKQYTLQCDTWKEKPLFISSLFFYLYSDEEASLPNKKGIVSWFNSRYWRVVQIPPCIETHGDMLQLTKKIILFYLFYLFTFILFF